MHQPPTFELLRLRIFRDVLVSYVPVARMVKLAWNENDLAWQSDWKVHWTVLVEGQYTLGEATK